MPTNGLVESNLGNMIRVPEYDPQHPFEWHVGARCSQTDPEVFFPEKGGSTRDAKKICAQCEVRTQCLEYALDQNERFGIWGGLSERERRTLRGIGRSARRAI